MLPAAATTTLRSCVRAQPTATFADTCSSTLEVSASSNCRLDWLALRGDADNNPAVNRDRDLSAGPGDAVEVDQSRDLREMRQSDAGPAPCRPANEVAGGGHGNNRPGIRSESDRLHLIWCAHGAHDRVSAQEGGEQVALGRRATGRA